MLTQLFKVFSHKKMEKSANKRWRESGTSLPFKEWINRENEKKSQSDSSFVNFTNDELIKSQFNSTINGFKPTFNEIDTTLKSIDITVPVKEKPYVSAVDESKVFGLDKNILIFSGLLVAGSLGFYFYKRFKNKK